MSKSGSDFIFIYLFIYLFVGGNVHHCGKVILKKEFSVTNILFYGGKKNQRKKENDILFSKSPKIVTICLQYE
jgi:hypothetical protein